MVLGFMADDGPHVDPVPRAHRHIGPDRDTLHEESPGPDPGGSPEDAKRADPHALFQFDGGVDDR
jgi:hypothetical protein